MAKEEYVRRNREWLEAKAREEGVKALDKGVLYKVIKSGNGSGANPDRGSVVTAHYVGKTINGRTFDSSRGGVAPAFRLRELIPGWVIAMTRMRVGDKWEVYIPAELQVSALIFCYTRVVSCNKPFCLEFRLVFCFFGHGVLLPQ